MQGKRLIEKIRLRNILSFGDKDEEITLEPLNIIIGQNASGKSNLVDVIKLLRSLPQEKGLANFISQNGGISEWIWKGEKKSKPTKVEVFIHNISDFKYSIAIENASQRAKIIQEEISNLSNKQKIESSKSSHPEVSILSSLRISLKDIKNKDVLELALPIIGVLSESKIKTYTDLSITRSSKVRNPQILSLPKEFISEDANNLNLVLKDVERKGNTKDKIVENLKKFNPKIKDYSFEQLAEYIYLFIREDGLKKPISAMRLSDGTLRYLCLLAILCHPEPPPLICIEEPETGLHPDILPTIAELMIEASQRTQLIVTTHSDILVSAFSEIPEAVLVCEKDEDGTHFTRLNADKLKVWLEEYTLGEAWLRGAIGGTRW